MLSYDYPKTNNPFEIAEFIFQNIQRGDVFGIYKSCSDDSWPTDTKAWILSKSCKITDIILDENKKNEERRSFILREPFTSKKDSPFLNPNNEAVLYRYTIIKMLVKGYGICINFASCPKKDRKVVGIDASKWLKDMGYLNFPLFTFDEYAIEKAEDYLMNITEYLKNCDEVYENELFDIKGMIDYFYHVVTGTESWPTYYTLKQKFWWVYSAKTKVYKESEYYKKHPHLVPIRKKNKSNEDENIKSNEDAKNENAKLDLNAHLKVDPSNSDTNSLKMVKFNIGDIVEDYNGNVGYISKIITKDIQLPYNKTMKTYRYKWQPLYLKSNELDLKTPISLYYKRVGNHVFITRENEEQVAKRREKLQEAARLCNECCKKLKDIENHAKKVTEQIKTVVENVKTSTSDNPDNVKSDNSNNVKTTEVDTKSIDTKSDVSSTIEETKDFENLSKYLKMKNNTSSDISYDTNRSYDIPALPNKLDFSSSKFDITSYGCYNEMKEEALCNTINDIIEFLRYLE